GRGDRKLSRIVQAWIEESSHSTHVKRRHKCVPIGNRSPRTGPGVLIEACQTESVGVQRRSGTIRSGHYSVGNLLRIKGLAIKKQLRFKLSRPPAVEHCSHGTLTDT